MSNPNFPTQSQNDARYATPASVTSAIATQAMTDAGQYAPIDAIRPATIGYIRASDYGVGTGVADAANLQAAINAARASGYQRVVLPSKTLTFTSPVDFTGIKISGDGATRILQSSWSAAALMTASGSLTTSIATLTVDALENDWTLTLNSTASISIGDSLLLGANTQFYGSIYANQYKGELVRVAAVNSSTVVTLQGPVRDKYKVSDSGSVDKVNLATGSAIEGVTFQNTGQGAHNSGFIKFSYCDKPRTNYVDMLYSDVAGITWDTCRDARAEWVTGTDFSDDEANGRFGYGIAAVRATQGGIVTNSNFRKVRHAFTTAAIDGQRGVPRDILVTNSQASECSLQCWDTHPAGENIEFRNVLASGSPTFGFYLRGRSTKIRNCTAEYVPFGVYVDGGADGSQIVGNTIRKIRKHTTSVGSGGIGIMVGAAVDHINIQDNLIQWTDAAGMYINANLTRSRITRNAVLDTGQNDTRKEGIYFHTSVTAATANYLDDNTVGNTPTGAINENNVVGAMSNGISLSSGVTNSFVRGTRQHGSITGSLVSDGGTGNTVS